MVSVCTTGTHLFLDMMSQTPERNIKSNRPRSKIEKYMPLLM